MPTYVKFSEAIELPGRKFEDLEVEELGGSLKLASLPAGKALEFKELHAEREKGGKNVERRQMLILLMGGIVNEDKTAFFVNEKDCLRFIEKISMQSLNLIVKKISAMMKGSNEDDAANP